MEKPVYQRGSEHFTLTLAGLIVAFNQLLLLFSQLIVYCLEMRVFL